MSAYQEILATKVGGFLEASDASVDQLVALTGALFPYATLEDAGSAFKAEPVYNQINSVALITVRDKLSELISNLDVSAAWISLSVPQIEDGGNFGVTIQLEIRKAIMDAKKDLVAQFDALADYHDKRAALVAKATNLVKIDKKESESSSTSTGGEKDEAKTSKSSSTDTSQSLSEPLKDQVDALVDFDVKWYFTLLCSMNAVINQYASISNLMRLNKEKLEKPRGSGGGGFTHF